VADSRVPPNRLSAEAASPYYDREALPGLTVRRDGKKLSGVVEYSLTGRWARVHMLDGRGNPKRERGKLQVLTVFGSITASYDDAKE